MTTPIVTTGPPKPEAAKPAREAKPPTHATRAGTRGGDTDAVDRAAISARSQAAAARTRAEDGDADAPRIRSGGPEAPPAGAERASQLARDTSRQIVMQPVVAARAQANSHAASVLAMLQ